MSATASYVRSTCRCDFGGTRLALFGVRASHRVRIKLNDTAPRTHKFTQVDRTKTMFLLARPANVHLAALYSLLAFTPPIACAFGATMPRHARASSPGPMKCPAITHLRSTNTSWLELSQLGSDASPPAPPPSNVHSPGINPNLNKRPRHDSPSAVHISPIFYNISPFFSTSPAPWLDSLTFSGFDLSGFGYPPKGYCYPILTFISSYLFFHTCMSRFKLSKAVVIINLSFSSKLYPHS